MNQPKCVCGNCEWSGLETELGCQLGDVPDLFERIEPGGEVPVGECPECGALAYLQEVKVDAGELLDPGDLVEGGAK